MEYSSEAQAQALREQFPNIADLRYQVHVTYWSEQHLVTQDLLDLLPFGRILSATAFYHYTDFQLDDLVAEAQRNLVLWVLTRVHLLRAKPVPPRIPVKPRTSPNKPALNPSYSQIVKTSFTPRAHDPGKPHVTTCDHQSPSISRITTRDPGNVSGDLPRDWSPTRSLGCVNFKCAMHLLIHTWQMVGTINERMGNQQSHKTPNNWGNSPMRSKHPNRRAPIEDGPTCPCLSNLSRGQNSHLLALCKPTLNYAQTTLY